MTNVRQWLAGGALALFAAMLFGLAGFPATEARAQLVPPARFAGSVTLNGLAAPAGTIVQARIGSTVCGTATTFNSGSEARYVIDVMGAAETPGCGTDGAVVTFTVAGSTAAQVGSWQNFQLNILNLTAPTATPTPTTVPSTPAATATGAATTAATTTTATPRPPSTGSGNDAGSSAATWLLVALGAGAIAFSVGGAAALRRTR